MSKFVISSTIEPVWQKEVVTRKMKISPISLAITARFATDTTNQNQKGMDQEHLACHQRRTRLLLSFLIVYQDGNLHEQ